MPYNLLLLPLMGGFLLIHITHLFRFNAQRLDGYRLLFQSAVAGTCLSVLARSTVLLIELTPFGPFTKDLWNRFSPFAYSGTSAIAFILGPVLAVVVNIFIGKEEAKHIELRTHGDLLMRLFQRAVDEKLLLSVTLDTRKWYVGWVAESPSLDPRDSYFRLLPLFSGFRDPETLETFRTVFYEEVLNDPNFDTDEFVITLPLKDIKIAGLFNEDVYNEYFAEPEEAESQLRPEYHRDEGNADVPVRRLSKS